MSELTTSTIGRATRTVNQPGALATIQLILAYEWLISGIDKLLDPHFGSGLVSVLQQSTHDNPYGWYTAILRTVVLPNHTLFAFLTPLGELTIGLVLALTAGLAMFREQGLTVNAYVAWARNGALLASAFLSLNYFFQGGTNIPWINPNVSFTEGVDIDILIPLISITLFAANTYALVAAGSAGLRSRPLLPPRTGGTLPDDHGPETLGSHLLRTLNDSSTWVDGYGVCWTAEGLLHGAPSELLGERIAWATFTLDDRGQASVDRDASSPNGSTGRGSSTYRAVMLPAGDRSYGPLIFLVARPDQDAHAGFFALCGPSAWVPDLTPAGPGDVPPWPAGDAERFEWMDASWSGHGDDADQATESCVHVDQP